MAAKSRQAPQARPTAERERLCSLEDLTLERTEDVRDWIERWRPPERRPRGPWGRRIQGRPLSQGRTS